MFKVSGIKFPQLIKSYLKQLDCHDGYINHALLVSCMDGQEGGYIVPSCVYYDLSHHVYSSTLHVCV